MRDRGRQNRHSDRPGQGQGAKEGFGGIGQGRHSDRRRHPRAFQADVAFRDLAFAVIDEQHRFGVHQRLDLAAKGAGVDVLVMAAIPRADADGLRGHGCLETPGKTARTKAHRHKGAARRPIARHDPWTCPRLAGRTALLLGLSTGRGSEALDLAAAEERFDQLSQTFPGQVGLVHGRMGAKAKDAVMADFVDGQINLLVATTVVEVGVNVPEATIMVVEHAERFGLAQLHQLRGRIGRGSGSVCMLLYARPLGKMARTRLEIIRETEDGFRIAEEDLRLRGAGELLGTRQSGFPKFRLAQVESHGDLLAAARKDAERIIETDPELTGPRGPALRALLYLFERDEAVRFLRSG